MEPCTVWVAGGHVVFVWAIETTVGCVSSTVEMIAAALVSFELSVGDGRGEVGYCWCVHVGAGVEVKSR